MYLPLTRPTPAVKDFYSYDCKWLGNLKTNQIRNHAVAVKASLDVCDLVTVMFAPPYGALRTAMATKQAPVD